jgi:hypothetical protein
MEVNPVYNKMFYKSNAKSNIKWFPNLDNTLQASTVKWLNLYVLFKSINDCGWKIAFVLTTGQEFAIRHEIRIESVVHVESTGEYAAAREAAPCEKCSAVDIYSHVF